MLAFHAAGKSDRNADERQPHAGPDKEPANCGTIRVQSHPDAHLLRSLGMVYAMRPKIPTAETSGEEKHNLSDQSPASAALTRTPSH